MSDWEPKPPVPAADYALRWEELQRLRQMHPEFRDTIDFFLQDAYKRGKQDAARPRITTYPGAFGRDGRF